jgi:hypothetical protein
MPLSKNKSLNTLGHAEENQIRFDLDLIEHVQICSRLFFLFKLYIVDKYINKSCCDVEIKNLKKKI